MSSEEFAAALQAQYARRAGPIGLTAEELDFEHFPTKNGYPGIPVKAWIRFPNCAELVDGEVFAWTAKAVEVTWKDGPVTYRTWVWSSAVTRREEMMNRNLGERTRGKNSKRETLGRSGGGPLHCEGGSLGRQA